MKFVLMKIGMAFLILWREEKSKKKEKEKEKEKDLLNQRPGLIEQCKPLGQTEHIQRFFS